MGGPEIWWIRGEGGDVIPMSLPLGEGLPQRLAAGALVRVHPDGTDWAPPAEPPAAKPPARAKTEPKG